MLIVMVGVDVQLWSVSIHLACWQNKEVGKSCQGSKISLVSMQVFISGEE